ncbi:MAG: hemerythrin domain-containing protein [Pseudorhodoplanes sp.]|uniref:hemerythrin domain-containing protein n=1 Tax=Pseudorhodoplanes sp. TaxID=1934341 RepID=UPI003D0AEF9F
MTSFTKPAVAAMPAADLALATRARLPDDLTFLVARYPREIWDGHSNLGDMARFWLSRHAMFRELGAMLDEVATRFRDGGIDAHQFAGLFAPRLQFFLQQLHAHHHIEDDYYFPIFRRADARLVRGFDMLESDHEALAAAIENSVTTANDFLRAIHGPSGNIAPAATAHLQSGDVLLRSLTRHLDDEEDLIVPLILDRGEPALGVGH